MPYSRITEQALLKWVNTFSPDAPIDSLEDLTDGVVFSMMLADIDPTYSVTPLDQNTSSSKWLSKKKNLEIVYKALLRYIRDHCAELNPVAFESRIDFNAIAEHDDTLQTVKLITIFLVAAVGGPKKQDYIPQILRLDSSAQAEIMKIIQEGFSLPRSSQYSANITQSTIEAQQIAVSNTSASSTSNTDPGLALEEEHAFLYAEYETLKKKHADFITRFERLQQSHDELLEHSNAADRRVAALEDSNDDDKTEYIKSLKAEIDEQNGIIATHEAEAEANRVTKEKYMRELMSLRPMASQLTECQDQLQELKVENLALSRKANTVDHFQKKLEMKMQVEKDNASLRHRVDVLEENQKDYDKVHEENFKIKTTLDEYSKRFQQQELNIVELSSQKNLLKQELQSKDHQISELEERRLHDEKFILDLQEQVRTNSSGPLSPDSPTATHRGLNLEEELEQSDTPNYALEISRLKAENQLLKSNTAGTTNASLRLEIEEGERIRKQLEERYQDLFEKHAIGQQQLNAMLSNSSDQKNESVLETRKLYLETNQELIATKAKLAELQFEITERDRQLLDSKADLAAVDKEELDAVEDLKATNEIIHTSLENDLVLLQEKHKALTTDFEVQKNHLLAALVSKENLVQELTTLKEQPSGKEKDPSNQAKILEAEKKVLNDQIQKHISLIDDLQLKIATAEESSPDIQKAANEAAVRALKRENDLISTAWYDLSSRLQSNHVVLQRRPDAPKSWLNKQRLMVNATGRR